MGWGRSGGNRTKQADLFTRLSGNSFQTLTNHSAGVFYLFRGSTASMGWEGYFYFVRYSSLKINEYFSNIQIDSKIVGNGSYFEKGC